MRWKMFAPSVHCRHLTMSFWSEMVVFKQKWSWHVNQFNYFVSHSYHSTNSSLSILFIAHIHMTFDKNMNKNRGEHLTEVTWQQLKEYTSCVNLNPLNFKCRWQKQENVTRLNFFARILWKIKSKILVENLFFCEIYLV